MKMVCKNNYAVGFGFCILSQLIKRFLGTVTMDSCYFKSEQLRQKWNLVLFDISFLNLLLHFTHVNAMSEWQYWI